MMWHSNSSSLFDEYQLSAKSQKHIDYTRSLQENMGRLQPIRLKFLEFLPLTPIQKEKRIKLNFSNVILMN